MSNLVSTKVWDQSGQKDVKKLLMLAIADNASDDGVGYPGIELLSRRIGRGERQTQRLLRDLERTPELYSGRMTGGRGKQTGYFITLGLSEGKIATVLVDHFGLDKDIAERTAAEIVNRKGDIQDVTVSKANGDTIHDTLSDQKGDIRDVTVSERKRVTSGTQKGDIAERESPTTINTNTTSSLRSDVARPKIRKAEPQPWSALTKAMHEAIPPDIRPVRCNYGKNAAAARQVFEAGFSVEEVGAYVQDAYRTDKWIRGEKPGQDGTFVIMYMGYVADHIRQWQTGKSNGLKPSVNGRGRWVEKEIEPGIWRNIYEPA